MRRFTTFETVDLVMQVKKRDGTYQDFQQDKLTQGMDAACRHTRVSHDQVRVLASQIKADLMAGGHREIESRVLGEIVMEHLRKLDVVAYIRFACVYKRFKHIDELVEAIRSISPARGVSVQEVEEEPWH